MGDLDSSGCDAGVRGAKVGNQSHRRSSGKRTPARGRSTRWLVPTGAALRPVKKHGVSGGNPWLGREAPGPPRATGGGRHEGEPGDRGNRGRAHSSRLYMGGGVAPLSGSP